jgi:hypothetical protein
MGDRSCRLRLRIAVVAVSIGLVLAMWANASGLGRSVWGELEAAGSTGSRYFLMLSDDPLDRRRDPRPTVESSGTPVSTTPPPADDSARPVPGDGIPIPPWLPQRPEPETGTTAHPGVPVTPTPETSPGSPPTMPTHVDRYRNQQRLAERPPWVGAGK